MASSTSKNTDEVDGKPGLGALFVKVSMDGAPYLRKVDLRTYTSYQQLSSALEKMFSCFTLGENFLCIKQILDSIVQKNEQNKTVISRLVVYDLRSMWTSWSSREGKNERDQTEGSSSWIRICAYL